MSKVASKDKLGPMNWIKTGNEERIDAAFGCLEGWENIPDWDRIDLSRPDDNVPEMKTQRKLDSNSVKEVVRERGGELSEDLDENVDAEKTFLITCCLGHRFRLNAKALIAGGHWCPDCLKINL